MEIRRSTPGGFLDSKSHSTSAVAPDGAFAELLRATQQATFSEASQDKEEPTGPVDLKSVALLLPTPENIERLANEAASELSEMFAAAGIPAEPPVEFKVDPYDGKVSVDTDRAEKQAIAAALKANPKLELKIHNVAALASHIEPMRESLEFQEAYRGAKNATEVARVIDQFSYLFENRTPAVRAFSIQFDGSASIRKDGQAWSVES